MPSGCQCRAPGATTPFLLLYALMKFRSFQTAGPLSGAPISPHHNFRAMRKQCKIIFSNCFSIFMICSALFKMKTYKICQMIPSLPPSLHSYFWLSQLLVLLLLLFLIFLMFFHLLPSPCSFCFSSSALSPDSDFSRQRVYLAE